jgi:hypothetical protein
MFWYEIPAKNNPMRLFLIVSLAYSLLMGFLLHVVFYHIVPEYHTPLVYFIPPFLFTLFSLAHWLLISALKRDSKRFVPLFMGITGGKMMLSLFTILIMALVMKEGAKPLAVSFIAVYLPFMGIEVGFVLKELRSLQGQS